MRFLIVLSTLLFAFSSNAFAAELAAGKKVFNKCKACHMVGPKAKKRIGPPLNGLLGRPWGSIEDFKYSSGKDGTLMAIHEAEAQTWDVETLTAYLTKPKDVIPKTKMTFPGLKKDADIENVIFYLASFDADGNEADPEAVLEELAAAE